MKLNSLLKIFIISGFIVTAASCKKEEKQKSLPYLNDNKFSMVVPKYVLQGEQIQCIPSGIEHPKQGKFGYSVSLSKNNKNIVTDTLKTLDDIETKAFSYVFPEDTIGTYSLSLTAFAEGYNPSTFTSTIVLVGGITHFIEVNINGHAIRQIRTNPNSSLTGHGIDTDHGKYFDTENHRYFYTEATDGLYWMQNNLMEEGGKAYVGEEAMSTIFGRYYNYTDALKACPKGWRLPTAAEWEALIAKTKVRIEENAELKDKTTVPGAWCSDVAFNDLKMWNYWPASKNGFGELCNLAGMSILPCGYANVASMKFDGLMQWAMFWSADENPNNNTQAKVYGIYNYDGVVNSGYHDKSSFGASVRCVKEK